LMGRLKVLGQWADITPSSLEEKERYIGSV
jgi:hypothetical protein